MKHIYSVLIYILLANTLSAQCFEADANIWLDTWASCQENPNPKSEYGNGHWVQYNFGGVKKLSKSWVWNTNDPNRLDQGFNVVKVDYSTNGEEWTYWGEMNFPQGEGTAIYGGFPGPDLVNIEAQYILLTAISNHGHPGCAGIAEIKFNLLPGNTSEGDSGDDGESECAEVEETFIEEITSTEAFIVWEYEFEEEQEDIFFFQYREEGEDWITLEIEESEVFLEDLDTGVTYEFRIGIDCDGTLSYSDIHEFTTGEDAENNECCEVEEIYVIEVTDIEAFLEWECETEEDVLYLVEYREEGGEWMTQETEEPEIFLEDLNPDTEYELRVASECEGEWIYSDEVYFTTEEGEGECYAVEDIWDEFISDTEALIEWEEIEDVELYFVNYSIEGESDYENLQTEEPEALLEDLEAETSYELQVGFECDGEEIWSDLYYFTTEDSSNLTIASNETAAYGDFQLYPNPTNDHVTFKYSSESREVLNYSIRNVNGQVVISNIILLEPGNNLMIVDLSGLVDGVYFFDGLTLGKRKRIGERIVKI